MVILMMIWVQVVLSQVKTKNSNTASLQNYKKDKNYLKNVLSILIIVNIQVSQEYWKKRT
jgi:hypothetical protein